MYYSLTNNSISTTVTDKIFVNVYLFMCSNRISPLIQHRDKSSNAPPVEGLYDNTRCGIDEISKTNVWGATPTRATVSVT